MAAAPINSKSQAHTICFYIYWYYITSSKWLITLYNKCLLYIRIQVLTVTHCYGLYPIHMGVHMFAVLQNLFIFWIKTSISTEGRNIENLKSEEQTQSHVLITILFGT